MVTADNMTITRPKRTCYDRVEEFFGGLFKKYGQFVAKHPWKVLLIVLLANGLLGIGMIRLNPVIDVQEVYTPIGSQSSKDCSKLRQVFPDASGSLFLGYQMPDTGRYGEVIVKSKTGNMLTAASLTDLQSFYYFLWTISTTDEHGTTVQLSDICAMAHGNCSIDGQLFVDSEFTSAAASHALTFPVFVDSTNGPQYYEQLVGGVNASAGILHSATSLLFRVNIRTDTQYYVQTAKKWQDSFIQKLNYYESNLFDIKYSHSDSLSEELNENVNGDITLFSLTFTLMITYACVASITGRCNCIGQRANLGYGGVLAAGLAIISAFGLGSLCGVDFVSIVGVVPFIGIGVDDMFMLMAGMSQTNPTDTVEERIGETMRTSGVSITITSLTDLLAFAAGASSVFLSVRNFCIYSALAVLFCYINQISFFLACLVINERRTGSKRHFASCMPVRTPSECREDGKSKCYIICCSGSVPEDRKETESFVDRFPKFIFPKLISPTIVKFIILCLFAIYLGVSIWGITQLEEGLELRNLVAGSSYYYGYQNYLDLYFPQGTYFSLVLNEEISYSNPNYQTAIDDLLTLIKGQATVRDDIEINWLESYRQSANYDTTSESAFVTGLQTFLSSPLNHRFQNDVVFNVQTQTISASRIHLISESIKDSQKQGRFMEDIRDIVDASSLPVFAFSPSFIFFEQFIIILSQTLQTVGIAVGMIFLVTCIFMPHPLLLIYVTITVAMITTGIFGFLPFLDLTLSSVTMIHVIMSIGFSVDFAAHICHGYMIAEGNTRHEKVINSIERSGTPIFHGATSSLLGIVILAFSKSYIFFSFFKVMSLVIIFGILHAILFLPVVLSLLGPLPNRNPSSISTKGSKCTLSSDDPAIYDADKSDESTTYMSNYTFNNPAYTSTENDNRLHHSYIRPHSISATVNDVELNSIYGRKVFSVYVNENY